MELGGLDNRAALISMPLCCFMRVRNTFVVSQFIAVSVRWHLLLTNLLLCFAVMM